MKYIINSETSEIIGNPSDIWGAQYVESGGTFPGSNVFKPPWRVATSIEIDSYLLKTAKEKKIAELKEILGVFIDLGCQYPPESGIFFGLDNDTIINIRLKEDCPDTMPQRYSFADKKDVRIDFGDNTEFTLFKNAVVVEKDRVMVKYTGYKVTIALCQTVQAVEDITVDFSA